VAGAVGSLLARDRLRALTVGGEALVALARLVQAEAGVAAHLRALASRPPSYPAIDVPAALAWAEQKTGTALADGQRAAAAAALTHRVVVITGGPGVGKTTLVNTILAVLRAKGVTARLAAPTGRAAKRLAESTALEAKTLHRLLEYQPARGFGRNAMRPLDDADLFVIDEASMIDAPLMHALLQALPETAHLLVVGDVDQLPSVGPGAVLADVIASGAVPVARLTEVFRQAATSRIVRAAHALNRGELPDLEPAEGSDFYFVERPSPEAIATTVAYLVRERVPRRFGFDPVRDIQVLTPMHRGPAGTRNLNHALQAALNPPAEFKTEVERFGTLFRTGDKVIQTRNNYDLDVYNGDIGTVVEITSEPVEVTVRFGDPAHHHLVSYKTTELDELEPAYAITVHKSQGSEFPCVVVPVTTSHYVMLQRNLFYTAITRGRKLVVLVGQRRALATAARTPGARRSTLLGHFMAASPDSPRAGERLPGDRPPR
jgi:exodeoxyribonuclease V alpha subunit